MLTAKERRAMLTPTKKTPERPLKVGEQVRLERGLLAGKQGEVRSQKGEYFRVRIGTLEVNVKASDLSRVR